MLARPSGSSSDSPQSRRADGVGAGAVATHVASAGPASSSASAPSSAPSSPASPKTEHVTQLLEAARSGRRSAADQLLPLVYDELRALAASLFRTQRRDHTLQPTALVHEAYARLVKPAKGDSSQESGVSDAAAADSDHATPDAAQAQWTGRAHFFAVAAKAMRQVLANHARDRRASKRGGGWQRITLSEQFTPADGRAGPGGGPGRGRDLDLLALDEALAALSELDERQARIVELRFFAEMTSEEIAHVLDVSVSTVEREWRMARAWLSGRLRSDDGAAKA